MKQERIPAEPSLEGEVAPAAPPHRQPPAAPQATRPRLRTGLRAGDIYMHSPRGSNNRLNSPD